MLVYHTACLIEPASLGEPPGLDQLESQSKLMLIQVVLERLAELDKIET